MAAATTRIIEQCRVAPSAGAPAQLLLKLLHFDMFFLTYNPLHYLTLYEFGCSESHFTDTIVPSLKRSLSLTLKHFLPMAGRALVPHTSTSDDDNNRIPFFHYVSGEDSAPLTIAICNADFEYLASYRSREAHELLDLVPKDLSPGLAAFQVTLFPNKGVCVGITSHHSVGNSATLLRLLRTWSSINRTNGDGSPDVLEWLPSIERDAVTDSNRLAVEFWKASKLLPSFKALSRSPTARRVRATFVLSEEGIMALKTRAFPDEARVSSFALAIAHIWTCLARSAGEEVEDDEAEYLIFPMSCHRLVNPPLPSNYFGNCIAPILVESTHGKLRGEEGFSAAAEAIGGTIRKVLGSSDDRGIMDVSCRMMLETLGVVGKRKRMVFIGGSARLDFYGTDFGWGRPVKFESLQDHNPELVFVSKSREYRGGMEFIVMMPKPQMDVFSAFFGEGLPTKEKICCKM